MRKLFTICLASLQIACAAEDFNNKSYEWDIYPVPADAGDGMVWKLHPQSDDFNYVADEKDKGKEFYAKLLVLVPLYSGPVKALAIPPLWGEQ
jgi:agarase